MYTVEQIIKAQEQGRLLILPTTEEIQERSDAELYGFCKVGECSQVYSSKGSESCEGAWCDEAYTNWLRNIYDVAGIEYNP